MIPGCCSPRSVFPQSPLSWCALPGCVRIAKMCLGILSRGRGDGVLGSTAVRGDGFYTAREIIFLRAVPPHRLD